MDCIARVDKSFDISVVNPIYNLFLNCIGKTILVIVLFFSYAFPHCWGFTQWGKGIFRDEKEKIFSLNIAFSSNRFIAVATDVGSGCYRLGITPENKNDLHVWVIPENNESVVHGVDFYWIAIGK